jgi:hypothetical protein
MSTDLEHEPKPGWHPPLPARLPRPTASPALVALGACFLAWGVVTSWVFSVAGLAMLASGIGGWIREMRHDRRLSDQ